MKYRLMLTGGMCLATWEAGRGEDPPVPSISFPPEIWNLGFMLLNEWPVHVKKAVTLYAGRRIAWKRSAPPEAARRLKALTLGRTPQCCRND